VLPSLARISRATPRASAVIREPDSSVPIAAADAIATIAAETIAGAAADPIVVAAAPAAVLDSNVGQVAARSVITAVTPDRRAVLSSSPKC
jgi:hypothetical protein